MDKTMLSIVKIRGDSMIPTLNSGDKCFLCEDNEYRVGDIVVFRYYVGKIIVHRIIAMKGDIYVCCGDNAKSHEIIRRGNIIGKIICKI